VRGRADFFGDETTRASLYVVAIDDRLASLLNRWNELRHLHSIAKVVGHELHVPVPGHPRDYRQFLTDAWPRLSRSTRGNIVGVAIISPLSRGKRGAR
jgi:hypothetical protein